MYRKIMFISINLFTDMSIFSKAVILLFFSFLSLMVTFNSKPFLLREMNYLEFYSNISASLTIFSGALFITDINDYLKALCFSVIIFVNGVFALIWLTSMISLVFHVHHRNLERICPCLVIRVHALRASLGHTKYQRGSFIYLKQVMTNYTEFKMDLICDRKKEILDRKKSCKDV